MTLSALRNIAREYTDTATVHGVGYILSSKVPLSDRLLWLCLVVLGLCLSVFLAISSFSDWQENLVITSLSDTVKPVTEIPFPAVTICTEGLNMDNVNTALANDFLQWINDMELPYKDIDVENELRRFLKEKYGVDPKSGVTIQDIVSALSFPNIDEGLSNAAAQDAVKCNAKEKKTVRKKRFACPSDFHQFESACYKVAETYL